MTNYNRKFCKSTPDRFANMSGEDDVFSKDALAGCESMNVFG
jgi:hypothetical protein